MERVDETLCANRDVFLEMVALVLKVLGGSGPFTGPVAAKPDGSRRSRPSGIIFAGDLSRKEISVLRENS